MFNIKQIKVVVTVGSANELIESGWKLLSIGTGGKEGFVFCMGLPKNRR